MKDQKKISKEDAFYYKSKHTLEKTDPNLIKLDDIGAISTVPTRHIERYEKETGKPYFPEKEKKPKRKGNILLDRISQVGVFSEENPFFYDKNKIWWKWNKNEFRYEKSDEVEILGMSYDEEGSDIVTSKERSEIVNALKHIGRKNQPKETKESWVQFKDKIIDIETGDEIEASPRFFMMNPISFTVGESEETPSFDKLFIDWVGEEKIIELYEILAFALSQKYFIHRIICLIGSGANGKTTFLTILRNFIGDGNVVSTSLESLMKVRFEGSKLYKKLVCLMGETNFGTLTQTDYIKGLSGEDKLRIEFKGKDSFDAVNYAKLIMATNSLPATADKTDGFYRRWKIINFNNKFKEEKDVLNEIPKEEYENLSLKLLNILKELWIKRVFTNDVSFEERKQKYEEHSNPINLFLKENFVKDVNSDYPSEDFREEFVVFLQERGFRELNPKVITQQLVNNGYEVKQVKINGVNKRCILGIKKQKVTGVTGVTGLSTRNTRKELNETRVTSVTPVTFTHKFTKEEINEAGFEPEDLEDL